jgi:hypothetical protein
VSFVLGIVVAVILSLIAYAFPLKAACAIPGKVAQQVVVAPHI